MQISPKHKRDSGLKYVYSHTPPYVINWLQKIDVV